jgi:hypothetical protein
LPVWPPLERGLQKGGTQMGKKILVYLITTVAALVMANYGGGGGGP